MHTHHTKEKTILSVTLINAGANFFLALVKVVIGWIGYSQALLADGIHSLSDVLSDILVFFTARASIQSPDKEHPYGHQRIETIGTVIIALILLSVALSIAYEALMRLWHHQFDHPTLSVIIVASASIILNEVLFHFSRKKGESIQSNLLISNAWHKRSDVFISIIVLFAVIGGYFGWLWLDAVGAIAISLFILKISMQMISQSIQELVDHAVDENTLAEIKKVINNVPGVLSIHQLRTRMHGQFIFVDLHIIVDPFISVSEGHHIGEQVHQQLMTQIKNLHDVTVHIDPEDDETAHPSVHLPNRMELKKLLDARWKNLPHYDLIKKMNLHYLEGHLYIEIFIPQSATEKMTSAELNALYQEAVNDLPEIAGLHIHITPEKNNGQK